MKKYLPLLLLSAFVQASEIDNLIQTSGSIRQTFDLGVRTVAGQLDYAQLGGISPDMATSAHLSYDQATAYNDSLMAVSTANTTMTAQEYFDTQSQEAMDNLSLAVDNYVSAASQLVMAVQVNDMASSVETPEQAVEVQTYISNNELNITTEQVDSYNDSLDMVQESAQTAASFMAIAADATLVESAQAQADELGQSFYFAEEAFYSQGNFTVDLNAGGVSLDVSGYIKSAEEVLALGGESTFYQTSPTGNQCFFSADQEACVE